MTVATNFMVPTENRPYLPVRELAGIGLKPMNMKADTPIWSAVMRIESGACLPKRDHVGLCEVFVVRGHGKFADGSLFQRGDYVREENGIFDKIVANSELVVFFTHHGTCRFLDDQQDELLSMHNLTEM